MMGNEKGHTQGMSWSVEQAQTKTMKVELCNGVKDCATAVVVVAGERASNRGIKNRQKKLQQQHICQRDTGNETGKNSLTACKVKLSNDNPRCSTKRQKNEV